MKRIYVAGKLNADACGYLQNVSAMMKAAITIRRMGFAVFVPCQDLLIGIVEGKMEYKDYTNNNTEWLMVSDGIYVLPESEESRGTQEEVALAHRLGIPVIFKLSDLKKI